MEGQRWKSPGLICVNCQSLEAKGSSTFSGSDGSKLPLVPLKMATGCGVLGQVSSDGDGGVREDYALSDSTPDGVGVTSSA